MESYSIPKFEVVAEVRLPGLPPRSVRLHLARQAERHFGPERVSDLLEGEKKFLPVTSPEGTAFLRRQALLQLSVTEETESLEENPKANARVEVLLEDGTRVSGRVSYVLPRERGRLQDFLNSGDLFMAVRDGEWIHYVNKGRIAWVRLAEQTVGDDGDH